MNPISAMAWRIGDLLELPAQLAWIRDNGFDAASFHSSPGDGQTWRGFPADTAGPAQVAELRGALAGFRHLEIHAPFSGVRLSMWAQPPEPSGWRLANLVASLRLAAEVGAKVLTVHVEEQARAATPSGETEWLTAALTELATLCPSGLRIGVETNRLDFLHRVLDLRLAPVGLTLDVGHLYLGSRPILKHYGGSLAALIRDLGPALVHFHLHGVRDGVDHLPPGGGDVAFDQVFDAAAELGYKGCFCWEINPDRGTPAEIAGCAAFTRSHWQRHRTAACGGQGATGHSK